MPACITAGMLWLTKMELLPLFDTTVPDSAIVYGLSFASLFWIVIAPAYVPAVPQPNPTRKTTPEPAASVAGSASSCEKQFPLTTLAAFVIDSAAVPVL